MKFRETKKYLGIFILAVLIIAVYKTFDNIGNIFSAIGSFFSMLSPIIIAFVIAFLLYPMCKKTEKFVRGKFPAFLSARARVISVLSVFVFSIAVVAGILYILLPPIIESLIDFVMFITANIDNFIAKLNESEYIEIDLNEIDKYIDLKEFLANSGWLNVELYTSTIMDISSWIVDMILSLVMSIYILLDRESLASFAKKIFALFVSKRKRDFIMVYVRRGVDFAYKYLFCIVMDAIIVFILCFTIMSIMGIEHAAVLALMVGIFNIIPYFGAIGAGVVAVLVTMATSGGSTWIVLGIVLIVLQQIDANVIQPHLVNESLNVKPFWVLVGILVGGYLFGLWGILIAVPVLALCKTIINDYFEYRKLKCGDSVEIQTEKNK